MNLFSSGKWSSGFNSRSEINEIQDEDPVHQLTQKSDATSISEYLDILDQCITKEKS